MFSAILFIYFFKYLYWSIITLQCYVSSCCITKWISYMYTYIPLSPSSCASLSPSLSHDDLSVLCSCFPLAIYFIFGSVYMSMQLSHLVPANPSLSPCLQVHFLLLCLYSCPVPRFMRTIFFRFHIYMLAYCICFSLSDLLNLQFFHLSSK